MQVGEAKRPLWVIEQVGEDLHHHYAWDKVKSTTEGSTFAWLEWQKTVAIPRLPSPTLSVTRIAMGIISSLIIFLLELVTNDSGLAPQLQGNQLGKKPFQHYAEVDSTQTGKLMDRHPLVLRE